MDVLADGWTYAAWVVGTSRIRSVDPSWPNVGSQLSHSVGLWPATIDDVTMSRAWDPARFIELRAHGWPMGEAWVRIEVVPTPTGCRVSFGEDVVRGPARLIPPALRAALFRPRNVESLRRLCLLAIGRAGSSSFVPDEPGPGGSEQSTP